MKLNIAFLIVIVFLCSFNKIEGQNSMKIVGGNVKITDNVAIVLKDCQLQNNGTITATNGTVEIKGTGTKTQSEIGGTGISIFHNLKINKSSNDAQLGASITVNNQMELASGKLDLAPNTLTLGTTNGLIIGENEMTYITSTSNGRIIKAIDLNAPNSENVGNMGIEISSSANLGMTEIRRGHDPQILPTGSSILRHFTIVPTNNVALDASLTFHCLDAELNGIPEAGLAMLENNGGWMIDGFDSRDATNNTLTFSGYDGLFQYTLGLNEADLDMDGISAGMDNCPNTANADQVDVDNDMVGDVCDACANGDDMIDANMNDIIDDCECQNDDLSLSGTMVNSQNYIAGDTISSIASIRNSIHTMYKATTSITLSAGFHAKAGSSFLGIIATCQTPTPLISPAVVARIANNRPLIEAIPTLIVSPNPFLQKTTIHYSVPVEGNITLSIHDLTGQQLKVLLENVKQQKGEHTLTYEAGKLPAGMYIVSLQSEQNIISEQLILLER